MILCSKKNSGINDIYFLLLLLFDCISYKLERQKRWYKLRTPVNLKQEILALWRLYGYAYGFEYIIDNVIWNKRKQSATYYSVFLSESQF